MPSSRSSARWLAAALLLVPAAPAPGQDAPRSILPGEALPPEPAPEPPPPPPESILPPALGVPELAPPPPGALVPPGFPPEATPGPLANAPPPDPLATAPTSNVDLSRLGPLGTGAYGFGPGAFAGADGRYLLALARRLDAPLASRWASILLARALAAPTFAPAAVNPADWIAARVRGLMRLGRIDLAKALVDRVPPDRFTPGFYAAALDAHLAAGDVPAICPIAPTGRSLSRSRVWELAGAVCASIEGDDASAGNAFDALRSERGGVASFDVSLAELASSLVGGTRSANLAWEEVDRLNLYRIGMANATGTEVPPELLEAAPAPVHAWVFRSAAAPETSRLAALPAAAEQGAASTADLLGFYAGLLARPEGAGEAGDVAARLRAAFVAGAPDRMEALRALWSEEGRSRYASYVLTAEPAMRQPPAARFAEDAPDLMAAALAGGRADRALRWWPLAEGEGGETATRAWPLAAVAGAAAEPGRFAGWLEAERGRVGAVRADVRARLLLAALRGLGPGWDGVAPELGRGPVAPRWAARIDAAAAAGRRGEVALLVAAGLQARDWTAVPPAHLERSVAALARVGLAAQARLLAAEALTRA